MLPTQEYDFQPNGGRAEILSLNMRLQLADSLAYLAEKLHPYFAFDQCAIDRIIRNLRAGQNYSVLLFALYTSLVFAIDKQHHEKVINLLNTIASLSSIYKNTLPEPIPLNSTYFKGYHNLLAELMNIEDKCTFQLQAPAKKDTGAFKKNLSAGIEIIQTHMPQLYDEIQNLVSEIIMVEPKPGSHMEFDGGSSYMLWGGLFLNVHSYSDPLSMVDVLVHESAHLLLFGFAAKEPLTLNDDNILYDSPLRADKRPMEGIFHAVYVSARMHWAMNMLLCKNNLAKHNKKYLQQAVSRHRANFCDGYNVVQRHAKLSNTGKLVMDEAYKHMHVFI